MLPSPVKPFKPLPVLRKLQINATAPKSVDSGGATPPHHPNQPKSTENLTENLEVEEMWTLQPTASLDQQPLQYRYATIDTL
jgi:hypothetical protein